LRTHLNNGRTVWCVLIITIAMETQQFVHCLLLSCMSLTV